MKTLRDLEMIDSNIDAYYKDDLRAEAIEWIKTIKNANDWEEICPAPNDDVVRTFSTTALPYGKLEKHTHISYMEKQAIVTVLIKAYNLTEEDLK